LEETDSFDLEITDGGKPTPGHLILFNDLILVTKPYRSLTLTGNKSVAKKFTVLGTLHAESTSERVEKGSKFFL